MLGVFRNTLTANDKYPTRDYVNFWSPIEMQLSLNSTICSDFFVPFPKCYSNFKHFEKKDDSHIYFIWEIRHCEKVG